MKKNPIEQTNEYLEYLAGRQSAPPVFEDEDKDIIAGAQLLRSMRTAESRPAFQQVLRSKVMQSHARLPKTPTAKTKAAVRPDWSWWWKLSVPAFSAAAILLAAMQLPLPQAPAGSLLPDFQKHEPQAKASNITLVATKSDALGVNADTSFTLTAKEGKLTQADVQANLRFTPAVELAIAKKSDQQFEIQPKQLLQRNTVYRATFAGLATTADGQTEPRTYAWAYQVKHDFQILGTLPRNEAVYVPVETGIEVSVTQPGVTSDDFKQHVSVSPAVDATYSVHNRTLVIAPKKPLKPKTIYTVTVNRGLGPDDSDRRLEEDYIFSFETGDSGGNQGYGRLHLDQPFQGVRTGEPLVFHPNAFGYYGGSGASNPNYEFTIYKYRSGDDFSAAVEANIQRGFRWAIYGSTGNQYPLQNLEKVATYKTTVKNGAIYVGTSFTPGFYLADSTSHNAHSQIPFIVTDLGAYAAASLTDTVVWAHDLKTGKPLAGARITADGLNETTNQAGLAQFTTPAQLTLRQVKPMIVKVEAGEAATYLILHAEWWRQSGWRYSSQVSSDYWSTIVTDRTLYQPTDTLNFWGFVDSRDDGVVVRTVRADLFSSTYQNDRYTESTVASTQLTVSPDGTYMGKLALQDLPVDGGKELRVYHGDELVGVKYLDVQTYRTPAFQLTLESDKEAYIQGDNIQYTVRTKFFDGTPVPNINVKLQAGGEFNLVTNEDGIATKTVTASINSSSYVTSEQLGESFSVGKYVRVYPAAVTMSAQGELKGRQGKLTGTVRSVNPNLVRTDGDDPYAEVEGGGVPGQTVTGKLILHTYEEKETGTFYDFLFKLVRKTYDYVNSEKELESFTLVTNAKGEFSKTFSMDPKHWYSVRLETKDQAGRLATLTTFFYTADSFIWAGHGFNLVDVAQDPNGAWPVYSIGENVHLQVRGDNQRPAGSLSYLFMKSLRGIREVEVSGQPDYRFTFGQDDIPGVWVRSVIFSGHGYKELWSRSVGYRTADQKLTVDLTTDRASYAVRDQVRVNIKVTDPSGRGRAARVNLKAVDEAVLSLQPYDWQGPLSELFRQPDEGIVGSFISHQQIDAVFQAEGGGGGGERSEFKDTALFTEIVTNANGQGTATFQLPDNLTSWRVTGSAVTSDYYIGQSSTLVPVTKPVFAVVTMEQQLLERDRASVLVTPYGSSLRAGDRATVSLTVDGQTTATQTKTGEAFQTVAFNLGQLTAGEHTIRASVAAKGVTDIVQQKVTVLNSNVQYRTFSTAYLERGQPPVIAPSGRTDIRIGDADRNLVYELLWRLTWNRFGRLDESVASVMAGRMLQEEFQEPAYGSFDPSQYVSSPGLTLYKIGSPDLEYGALVAADPAFSQYRSQLRSWFRNTVDNPKSNTEQVVYGLYGLAQLGEPVLPEIQAMLAIKGLADTDRLTLALALEALGAGEEARPIALGLLQQYAQSEAPYVRLGLGRTDDEKIVATARMAILAAGLDLPEQYGLVQFIAAYRPKETTVNVELALASQRILRHASQGELSVTYTVNGQSVMKKLGKRDSVNLSLTKQEADTFSITQHQGNVSVVSSYHDPLNVISYPTEPNLRIFRTYKVKGKATRRFKRGDIVRIEFTWEKTNKALGKDFSIIDHLPSGLRLISPRFNQYFQYIYDTNYGWPQGVEGKRIKMYPHKKTVYYTAQAAVDGTFIAEPPILQAADIPGNLQLGIEETVIINP